MNTMEYKGYTAVIEYDNYDECLVGSVIGITDQLVFDGETVPEIQENFHNVLDNYLALCKKTGKQPEVPKSGKLSLRLPAELHAVIAQKSKIADKSVNQMVIDALTATYLDGEAKTERPAGKRRGGRAKRETAAAK
jgi:predicted HicB family RNase H-like nuclease